MNYQLRKDQKTPPRAHMDALALKLAVKWPDPGEIHPPAEVSLEARDRLSRIQEAMLLHRAEFFNAGGHPGDFSASPLTHKLAAAMETVLHDEKMGDAERRVRRMIAAMETGVFEAKRVLKDSNHQPAPHFNLHPAQDFPRIDSTGVMLRMRHSAFPIKLDHENLPDWAHEQLGEARHTLRHGMVNMHNKLTYGFPYTDKTISEDYAARNKVLEQMTDVFERSGMDIVAAYHSAREEMNAIATAIAIEQERCHSEARSAPARR